MEKIQLIVKSWKITDKYPCPKCERMIGITSNQYICKGCDVKIDVRMKFNF
jgi:hypothetical protein